MNRGFDTDPAGGEDSNEMPAGKQQHFTLHGAHTAHHAVCPEGHLLRRFTSGATIAEELPFRTLCTDLDSAQPLVLPIVPLNQVRIDFGGRAESGQFTSPKGALQGT